MSYNHLNINERIRIEIYLEEGYSARKIAKMLERHHSTISREIKRIKASKYNALDAQKDYKNKRMHSNNYTKYNINKSKLIEKYLNLTWSPEQIANRVFKSELSFKTIYRWIYQRLISFPAERLRHKAKRRKPKDNRGQFVCGKNISKRPTEVRSREIFGHWELDTVVSSRGKSKGCLATFVERKSRLYTAIKMRDRSANSMQEAIEYLLSILPKGAFKTATTDRGKEFGCYKSIKENYDIDLYFADAYSAWQRGSNENSNGLLREFYPKKTDLLKIDQRELTHNLLLINSRPRKCLGWKTPIEIFLHEVSHLA